jgi:long-subunit fatty acid transport protein
MGGTSIGLRDPHHINFNNPASYTAFDSTSFIFEGGVLFNYVSLSTNSQTTTRTYASVGYLTFGFPVRRWWRTSFALIPYSNVGYNISSTDNLPEIGNVTRIYTGSGGINRLIWGNGFKITKNLSVGVNTSFLFGSIQQESSSTFPDSAYYINFRQDNNIDVGGFYFDYGAQYTAKIKDIQLTVGAVFGTSMRVNAKTDYFSSTYFTTSGTDYPKDTIQSAPGIRGTITIPLMYGFGLSIEKNDKWLIGADYRWQNWQKYQAFGTSDSLVNSYQISAGAEFVPDINNYSSYFKRVRYRFGLMYDNSYLQLRGKQLNEYSISLGLGLPLRGMKTAINLSAELGTRGTTQSNLISETYFNFVLGFSIYERWFLKRKYF